MAALIHAVARLLPLELVHPREVMANALLAPGLILGQEGRARGRRAHALPRTGPGSHRGRLRIDGAGRVGRPSGAWW